MNYNNLTEIQEMVIPTALKKKDIIAVSQSGTGKTASYLIPVIHNLIEEKYKNNLNILRTLIIVPTRELANQISKNITEYSKYLNIKNLAIFGGISSRIQEKKIKNGLDILISTPGRLIEHINKNNVNLKSITTVIIDEFDTILDMGFIKDLETILPSVGKKRQIMMFSATINQHTKKLAKEFLVHPVVIELSKQRSSVKLIDQKIILVDSHKKSELLSYLVGSKNYKQVLVFVNMKIEAEKLVKHLELDGLKSACIHGDIRQTARTKFLNKFKNQEIRILVATDIVARGIDIDSLPLVVNYSLPQSTEDYTHRIGRTGRAGNQGEAITLLSANEYKQMNEIEKELIINIKRITIDSFEPTEKKPRLFKEKQKQLSQKKAESKSKNLNKTNSKNVFKKQNTKRKKITKRDDNKNFKK